MSPRAPGDPAVVPATVGRIRHDRPATTEPMRSRHLVGRDEELDRLTRSFGRLPYEGTVVVVDGEPGIGKTALVAATARAGRAVGLRHVHCAGLQHGASPGFSGLHQLLQPLLGGLPALPARQRAALSTALGLSHGDLPHRLMISLGALGLVEEAAHRRPLLLVVEDAHWLDRSSVDVIAFIARRIRHLPVVLIATLRDEGNPVELRSISAERLHLRPLPDDSIATILDRSAGAPAPSRRADILRAARGNPLVALELAAAFDRRRLTGELPDRATTGRLESAFLDRVAELPERSRALLLLAAAGEGMPLPEVMTAALRLGLDAADMTPLQRAGLVALTDATLTFRHPILPSAVYGAAPATEVVRAHLVLADVTSDAGRFAWHRAAASTDHDESVAASLEETARRAHQRGAQAEASAAFARSARLTPLTPNRGRRLALAAQAANMAGQLDTASLLLREAIELADDPDSIVRIAVTHLAISMVATLRGMATDDFRSMSRRLGGPGGRGYPEQRISILWCAAVNCRGKNLPQQQWRSVEADLDAIESSSPMKTLALATVVTPARAALLKPAVRDLVDRVPDSAYAMIAGAIAAEAVHDHPTALAAWQLGAEISQRSGAPVDEAQCLRGRGMQRFLAGDLSGALADADHAFHLSSTSGAQHIAGMAAAGAALSHVWLGDHQAAREMLGRLGETPAEAGGMASLDGQWAAGLLALDENRPIDAWEHLWDLRWHPIRALWSLADLTEVAVLLGRASEVADCLRDASVQAAAFVSPRLTMIVERALALVVGGDDAAAHFEASLVAGAQAGATLELARTRLLYGRWLRRRRRTDESKDHLALARHAFTEARAVRWAARAEDEVRASGMPTPPHVAADRKCPDLTPRELRIAQLAASGLTNKEIADQVYLSHRTVGAVLYRIFPKLGISKRAHLSAALTDLTSSPR
ncbi:helix-turn-helix transcriptional regulator [Paractinoplanes maris]|uniref:helix-turn-helix transcriptional regulator n=1 Tax=Paractinoplanes maris TaxID=1734446 RepID=UPI002020C713|nr:LuxR family transcriptional regulator [Actinoplanes maris]